MGKTPEELLNELSEADAALLGEDCQAPVSYTHLTLPTKLEV